MNYQWFLGGALSLCLLTSPAQSAGPSDKDKDCNFRMGITGPGSQEAEDIIKRMMTSQRPPGGPVPAPVQKPSMISIPLLPYMDQLGLSETLYPALPINSEKDFIKGAKGLLGNKDVVKRTANSYPVEAFSMNDSATRVAFRFYRTYFGKNDRSGHIFLARVDTQEKSLTHEAEIAEPDTRFRNAYFSKNDKHLLIDGFRAGPKLLSDLYLYNISGRKPFLQGRLSNILSEPINHISPLDSPDRSQSFFAVTLWDTSSGQDVAIISVDLETGHFGILGRGRLGVNQANDLLSYSYDDNRRGYIAKKGKDIHLINSFSHFEIINGQLTVDYNSEERIGPERSSLAAWLLMGRPTKPNQPLFVTSELTGQSLSFTLPPDATWGDVVPFGKGLLYIEANHPRYRQYLVDSEGHVSLLSKERLILTDSNSAYLSGTTSGHQDDVNINIFPK